MTMEAITYILLGVFLTAAVFWTRGRFADFLAQSPDDYANHAGEGFDLRQHLNGPMVCEGVIYGPAGRVTARFVADFDCHWVGNKGRMDEVFRYDDGSTVSRAWELTLGNDGRITATADDVEGEGSGLQCGNAVQLQYRYRLPESSGGHVMNVVDWMYLAPNGTIINRSQFRKFGIKFAELVATMRPAVAEYEKAA
jgi:hypothetical protein